MANYTWTLTPKSYTAAGSGAWNYPYVNALAGSATTGTYSYLLLGAEPGVEKTFSYFYEIKVADSLDPDYRNEGKRILPQNAVISSVKCTVRASCNSTGNTSGDTVQLYCGDTPKGSSTDFTNITGSSNTMALNTGTWSLDELKDLRLVFKGNTTVTTDTYLRFYGATLVIEWSDSNNSQTACRMGSNNSDSIVDCWPKPNTDMTCLTGQNFSYEFYPATKDADRFFIVDWDGNEETRIPKTALTYHQEREYTVTLHPTIMSYSDFEVRNANNACDSTTSTTYAYMVSPDSATTGSSNMKRAKYVFDTSSIPSNARITNVECYLKCARGTYYRLRCSAALFAGNTLKGAYEYLPNTNVHTIKLLPSKKWTRDEINSLNLVVRGYRTESTSAVTAYMFQIYGADLNITYAMDEPYYSYDTIVQSQDRYHAIRIYNDSHTKDDGTWKGLKGAYKKVNDVWEPIPNLDTELQDKVLVGDKYLEMPFSVEAKESGAVSWSLGSKTVQASKNDGEWTTMTSATSISVANGDIVRFKGTNGEYDENFLSCTGNFDVYGNMMSLIYGDDFVDEKELVSANTFYGLFSGGTKLVSAKNLRLPATTLKAFCYYSMFEGCTALEFAPALPATTLANYCYHSMFAGCTSLTTAPVLPATSLINRCYYGMFSGCTNLVNGPNLPATALANYCYSRMFENCTSLAIAPELPATTLTPYCYDSMFIGCSSLTIAPNLPAKALAGCCYEDMFQDCTSLVYAPQLPATTLGTNCYISMFENCTSLVYAPQLPATTLATQCYANMFAGCTSLTNAPVLPATALTASCYTNMFSGCTSLVYIKAMFTTIASNSTTNWVSGVAASGTFVKNVSATWTTTGPNGVPDGWTTRMENQ